MVWRAGGGGPIRRCIGSTGNLHSYTYQSQDTAITGTSMSVETRELAHSPIPIFRAGTPPVQARQAPGFCSTSPGAFYKIITPPMNSPRGEPVSLPPFERDWDEDVVRIVCISDTHSRHDALLRDPSLLPAGDVLIHAGDFTTTGTLPQMENFRDFLRALPYAHKVHPPSL
ncbi:metallophosphoesterase domain-containing protein 1, partial [Nannochloropsis gaditana]